MTLEVLLKKKEMYSSIMSDLQQGAYPEEVEKKIADIKAEYDAQRNADIEKAGHYINLLDELIDEAQKEQINDAPSVTCESIPNAQGEPEVVSIPVTSVAEPVQTTVF